MIPQLRPQQSLELPDQDEMVKISLTIPRSQVKKVNAWMQSDTWEKAQKIRSDNWEDWSHSLQHCVEMALHDHGGARVMAQFMASLYNGQRVKADVSDIGALDMANFEHLINAMRLCYESHREPHTFFENGNEIFERIIKNWGLEKRRRS